MKLNMFTRTSNLVFISIFMTDCYWSPHIKLLVKKVSEKDCIVSILCTLDNV